MVAAGLSRDPLAVRYGYIERPDFDYLADLAGDVQDFALEAKRLCRGNIPLYSVLFLGYEPAPHLRSVREEFMRYDRTLVQYPRDHGKSIIAAKGEPSHDLAYCVAGDKDYQDPRILIIQESGKEAEKTMRAIKGDHERGGPDNLLHLAFGDASKVCPKWGDDIILTGTETGKDPSIQAVGIGGSITGAHPKKIIGDDMVSSENSRTPHLRRLRRDWWFDVINPMIGTSTVVRIPHTPYYEDDLHAVLAKSKSYRLMRQPALNRWPEDGDYEEELDENGVLTKIGITDKGMDLESIWPCPLGTGNCPMTKAHFDEYGEHRPVEWLLQKYLDNPIKFGSQFMLEVGLGKDTRIKRKDLRFYSMNSDLVGSLTEFNDHPVVPFPDPADITSSVHAWDHAIGRKKQHDRTSLSRAYRTKDNDVFYINKAGRWDFKKVIKMMENNFVSDPIRRPQVLATEGIGFQQAYSEVLAEQSGELLPIETIKVYTDKDTALVESGLLGHFVQGKVFVDVEDEDTILELLNFSPAQRFHDDIVDSMRIAFHVLRRRMRRPVKVLGS